MTKARVAPGTGSTASAPTANENPMRQPPAPAGEEGSRPQVERQEGDRRPR